MRALKTTRFDHRERRILACLDAAIRTPRAHERLEAAAGRVQAALHRDPKARMAWEAVPLDIFGDALPKTLRSSWVFILRRGVTTGAERHPNSHQRTLSWKGCGDLQVMDGTTWRSHRLASDPAGSLEGRWLSIPPSTWHQVVVPGDDWVVVSFHTAPAEALLEERPDPADPGLNRRQGYAAAGAS